MAGEKDVNTNLGGGNFKVSTQFKSGAISHRLYADDSGTPFCC